MSSVAESDASSLEQKRALVARLLREKAGSRRDGTSLVHRRIEMQAERAPESVALNCAAESLTYSELNARANRVARRLRAMGVGPEVLVAYASADLRTWSWGCWPSSRRAARTCRSTRPIPPTGSPSCSTTRKPRSS